MARAAAAFLLLVLLSPACIALLPRVAAQGDNATAPPPAPAPPPLPAPPPAPPPAPVPFEPLPEELRAVAWRWLDQANATMTAFQRAHLPNATWVDQQRCFGDAGLTPERALACMGLWRDGAWDFLNESRLMLALGQLYHIEGEGRAAAFFPPLAEAERRERSLAEVDAAWNASRAALDLYFQRLQRLDTGWSTTHGVEYALLATKIAVQGDAVARSAPNVTDALRRAPAAEERIVRFALASAMLPSQFARWAGEVLDLAERVDKEGRPPLPQGGLDRAREAAANRLRFDIDVASDTGPRSIEAHALLNEANRSGVRVLFLGRWAQFQEARANDALEFRQTRGTLSAPVVLGDLQRALDDPTVAPRYDAQLQRVPPPGHVEQLRATGYQAVLQLDARNHARYTVRYSSGFADLAGAWGDLVGATFAAEALEEMPSPRPQGDGSAWLLYGGVAVVAALVVAAVAMLRRPAKQG